MRLKAKVGIVTAIGALVVTGPAVAEACTQGQQGQQGQHAARFGSDHGQFAALHRHGRRFGHSTFGTLVSWTATQTGTNTYSGTITVTKPAIAAHHAGKRSTAQPAQPTQVTYAFTNAKVFFGQGANPPAAGDLVKVIGAGLGHCASTGKSTSTGSGTLCSS